MAIVQFVLPATIVACKLTDDYFFHFSPLEQFHSDQGRQFECNVIAM